MSAPEHVSLTLSEYVRQVEQACSDLQPPVRHRLLADLEAHLRDQADGADLEATLGSPTEYARELRTAMDLPEAAPAPDSVRRRRGLIPALIAGVALAVVLGLVAIIVATVSSQPSAPGPKPTTSALPTATAFVSARDDRRPVTDRKNQGKRHRTNRSSRAHLRDQERQRHGGTRWARRHAVASRIQRGRPWITGDVGDRDQLTASTSSAGDPCRRAGHGVTPPCGAEVTEYANYIWTTSRPAVQNHLVQTQASRAASRKVRSDRTTGLCSSRSCSLRAVLRRSDVRGAG